MTALSEASTFTLSEEEDDEPLLELAVLDGAAAVPAAGGTELTILYFLFVAQSALKNINDT